MTLTKKKEFNLLSPFLLIYFLFTESGVKINPITTRIYRPHDEDDDDNTSQFVKKRKYRSRVMEI